jgi:hypothetical protein
MSGLETMVFRPFLQRGRQVVARIGSHGRRPRRLLSGVNPPNRPAGDRIHEQWRPVLKVVQPRLLQSGMAHPIPSGHGTDGIVGTENTK